MKQVIIVRNDLDISAGKMIAQACHASAKATVQAAGHGFEQKIVVHTDYEDLKERVETSPNDVVCIPVRDAGRTEIESGTLTAAAIMGKKHRVDSITGDLPLLKSTVKTRGGSE